MSSICSCPLKLLLSFNFFLFFSPRTSAKVVAPPLSECCSPRCYSSACFTYSTLTSSHLKARHTYRNNNSYLLNISSSTGWFPHSLSREIVVPAASPFCLLNGEALTVLRLFCLNLITILWPGM